MVSINSGNPGPDWDEQLSKLDGHILQSSAWASFQNAMGRETVYASGPGWNWLGVRRQGRGGIRYLSVAYGPVAGRRAAMNEAIESLNWGGRHQEVDFVRCEPTGKVTAEQLRERGLREFGEVQPRHTWCLDLAEDEAGLRRGLTKGHRSAVNAAERRGLSFDISDDKEDMDRFVAMMHATSSRGQFVPHPEEYYRKLVSSLRPAGAVKLYCARAEGKVVAAALLLDFNGVRYYAHAAGDQDANRKLQAAVPLVWRAIIDAKEQGYRRFDFFGVAPDENPKHPWAGFSRFKRSFGGYQVDYAGTWDLPIRSVKYRVYRLVKGVAG